MFASFIILLALSGVALILAPFQTERFPIAAFSLATAAASAGGLYVGDIDGQWILMALALLGALYTLALHTPLAKWR